MRKEQISDIIMSIRPDSTLENPKPTDKSR